MTGSTSLRYRIDEREQRLFDVGADLVGEFGRTYWRDHIRRREFPAELWAAIGERGHLATLVAEERGGTGGGLCDLALLTEGVAAAGFPMLTMITGPGLAIPAIAAQGSETLRREVLPSLLAGSALVAFAITEAVAGSNILNVATTAEISGGEVVITGEKLYTSIADVADHIMVVARTHDPGRDRLGYTLVVVPRGLPGLWVENVDTTIAAAERQSRVTLDRVTLPVDAIVGEPAAALRVLAPALSAERVLSGALSCGIGQYCLGVARTHALGRHLFNGPIAALQGVQHPLAEAHTTLAGARHLVRAAALADDDGDADAFGLANMACLAAGTAGWGAADAALQCTGGLGYTSDGELHDMAGLARLLRSAPVNAQSALSAIGEVVLGMPRSY